MQVLRHFDVFRTVQDRDRHLTNATSRGAAFSMVSLVAIIVLFLYETYIYMSPDLKSSMFIPPADSDDIRINFDISFHKASCSEMAVSFGSEVTGEKVPISNSDVSYMRLQRDVIDTQLGAYDGKGDLQNEGCRLDGHAYVRKTPGHLIFSALDSTHRVRSMVPVAHRINHLWIGEHKLEPRDVGEAAVHPVDGAGDHQSPIDQSYQYYLTLVPTVVRHERSASVQKKGYQFTASAVPFQSPEMPHPALVLRYANAPFAAEFHHRYVEFTHYLTNLCAVVGGVYTVVGMFVSVSDYFEKWLKNRAVHVGSE